MMSREGEELKGRGKRGGTKSFRASEAPLVFLQVDGLGLAFTHLLVKLNRLYRVECPIRKI